MGAKMFTIAGPVIVNSVFASVVYGGVYYFLDQSNPEMEKGPLRLSLTHLYRDPCSLTVMGTVFVVINAILLSL